METLAPVQATPNLPADPAEFYRAGEGMDALSEPAGGEAVNVLEKLGPPPFVRRGGFPLIGFLTTLYEHIATQAKETPTKG